jgi:hypothetical protein
MDKRTEPKTRIEVIEHFYNSGELQDLIKVGLISIHVLTHRKVFHLYNERIALGSKKMQAIEEVQFTFPYSDSHIYAIIKSMRS